MAQFTFIDLFAGIGGFRIGLSQNGGECLGFSEIDRTAIDTYCENFNEPLSHNFGDIKGINDLPQHDLLTAGVPCQSWSIAGRNLGFDDDRGQLWNDTIYLLNKSRPKAFIFENVKGLSDPRNAEALGYILGRIEEAGYFAKPFVINSYDYGVPQNRVRVYIIGFQKKKYLQYFHLPEKIAHTFKLYDFLDLPSPTEAKIKLDPSILFGKTIPVSRTRFQMMDELNDFFLFNDIRNGHSTIHSWDIIKTTDREKYICNLLLTNRRKSTFGPFDGNPLSIAHFQILDPSIRSEEILTLAKKGILKPIGYVFQVMNSSFNDLNEREEIVLRESEEGLLSYPTLKKSKVIKKAKFNFKPVVKDLLEKGVLKCVEERYDFKHSKISSGIMGINRIYLPVSDIFSTLVASDTNDYVATRNLIAETPSQFKELFLEEIFRSKAFRKITKEEACIIQGFPNDFKLPERREKWMKLLGNSVSVPVITKLCEAIIRTGVFAEGKVNFDLKQTEHQVVFK